MERYQDANSLFQLSLTDRTTPTEITAEFSLPDYRAEISRLLLVRPTLTPPEIFVGAGKAELSGTARYEVLYTDANGALHGAELCDGYHFTLPLESMPGAGSVLAAYCTTDAAVGRVLGPRKLQVRTRIHTRLAGYGEKELHVQLQGETLRHGEICRLCETLTVGHLFPTARETVTLEDRVDAPDDVRVISAHGGVLFSEVATGDECVHLQGELVATLLLCRDTDAIPYTISRRIPFSHDLLCPDATPLCEARATGTVGEMNITVEEDGVHLSPTLVLCAEVQSSQEQFICRDLFLPQATAEYRYATEPLFCAGHCTNRHFSVSGECSLVDEGLENAVVIDALAETEISEKTADGAKISLSGDVKCHLVCRLGEEYAQRDVSFPFRVQLEDSALDLYTTLDVPVCRAVIAGEVLRVDTELALSSRGATPCPTEVLSAVTLLPSVGDERDGGIEIYYPAHKETLWDVAKRYGCPPDAICEANGISTTDSPAAPDSLAGHKHVLIP